MSEKKVEFTKDNIDMYFNELSKEYKKLGGRKCTVEIVLIGGAAIIENYGFRNMTTDIDAIIPTVEIMKDAIKRVGDKYGLPDGWLNADFMKTSSYSPRLLEFSKQYRTFNQVLNVRYISGEYLIAMKLKSYREYKNDLSDIIGILAEHEKQNSLISFEAIMKAINNLYGSINQIEDKAVQFIKDVFKNGNFEKMYSAIRENEKNTKAVLIEFDEKYPGVLGETNVGSVLKNIEKKRINDANVRDTVEKTK